MNNSKYPLVKTDSNKELYNIYQLKPTDVEFSNIFFFYLKFGFYITKKMI